MERQQRLDWLQWWGYGVYANAHVIGDRDAEEQAAVNRGLAGIRPDHGQHERVLRAVRDAANGHTQNGYCTEKNCEVLATFERILRTADESAAH